MTIRYEDSWWWGRVGLWVKKKVGNSQIRQLLARPRPYSADEDWERGISGRVRTSAYWSPPCAPCACVQSFWCNGRAPSICIFASVIMITASDSCHTIIFKVPMWTTAHVMSSSCGHLTTCWQIAARSAVPTELGAGDWCYIWALPALHLPEPGLHLVPISVGSTLACQWNSTACPQSPGECHLSAWVSSPPTNACIHTHTHMYSQHIIQHLFS